jgi:hypothetical protein
MGRASITPMRTIKLDFEDVGSITLRRPRYGDMRSLGPVVEKLYAAATPDAVIYAPEFEQVLGVIVESPDDLQRILELDPNEIWSLWTQYIEFARFDDFFAAASDQQLERQSAIEERRLRVTVAQFNMMKKNGLVPEGLSIESALSARFNQVMGSLDPSPSGETEPNDKVDTETLRTPPSTTSTPLSTAGRRRK